jgi:hypothetical protein
MTGAIGDVTEICLLNLLDYYGYNLNLILRLYKIEEIILGS